MVGFLTIRRHFDHAAEITWMAVHASRRHHGIGRALVDRLCQDLAAEGFVLARDLPRLWPNDTAVLLVRPLSQPR